MTNNNVYTQTEIEQTVIDWMNETDFGSTRKDRFLKDIEDLSYEQKLKLEKWIISAVAIGIEKGYKDNEKNKSLLSTK